MRVVRVLHSVLAVFGLSAAVFMSSAVASSAGAQAVLDAPPDRVREVVVSSLEEAGYRVSEPRRPGGDVTARRTRVVRTSEQEDAAKEIARIGTVGQRWRLDVRSLSEYHVTMTVAMRPVESNKTQMDVRAQINGARRARGQQGKPVPVPIASNGVLEQEFVAHIQERLAQGAVSSP